MSLLGYLYVEFPIREGKSLFRMRYGVVKHEEYNYNTSKIRIHDRGSPFFYAHQNLKFKKNLIHIGKLVSESEVFKAVLSHVVEKFGVPASDVKLRWEKRSPLAILSP